MFVAVIVPLERLPRTTTCRRPSGRRRTRTSWSRLTVVDDVVTVTAVPLTEVTVKVPLPDGRDAPRANGGAVGAPGNWPPPGNRPRPGPGRRRRLPPCAWPCRANRRNLPVTAPAGEATGTAVARGRRDTLPSSITRVAVMSGDVPVPITVTVSPTLMSPTVPVEEVVTVVFEQVTTFVVLFVCLFFSVRFEPLMLAIVPKPPPPKLPTEALAAWPWPPGGRPCSAWLVAPRVATSPTTSPR